MVPTIAANGSSFKGAALYYLHDKDADSCERVAWTHTENLITDDAEKAWKVMAWTAKHQHEIKAQAGTAATGRKLQKPVFAFSVSWHPEQKPDRAHMLETAKRAVTALELGEYQAIYVCHNDEPQSHVHVLLNRIHPQTGKAATLYRSKTRLQKWALEYEQTQGKIYCQARAQNARSRAAGSRERACDPVITAAWRESDNGKSFVAALSAKGYTLAQGNRRFVVVDRFGKAINPVRHLPDVRASGFKARLADLDLTSLPSAATVQTRIKQQARKQYAVDRKYEKWSAEYLNKNQDRQIDERARLSDRFHRQLMEKNDQLAQHYKMGERRQAIQQLQERCEKASLLRRLSGQAKSDREQLAAQKASYRDAEQRIAEVIGGIERERERAIADQAAKHTRENELAKEYLQDRKPAFYQEQQEPDRGKTGNRNERRERDDGGRERSHYRCMLPPSII